MGHLALYQKYRSATFDEVVGQEYVVRSIQNAIKQNKYGHAYLFCGPRGTGKTTMARLLAKAVNCENQSVAPCEHCDNCSSAMKGTHPDIIEINAANETHVEDIRDLIERAKLAPMIGKHKVYIVDEVHQLSSSAASALLKTLEEPPSHVIFILATTDPQKLLNTIISRCQRFDFTKVDKEKITKHLLSIAEREQIKLERSAAEKIADLADGGMRDSLSILEQTAAYSGDNITENDINRVYGLSSITQKINLLENIIQGNLTNVLRMIQNYESSGIDLRRFTSELIDVLKDVIIYASTKDTNLLRVLKKEQVESLSKQCTRRSCLNMIESLMKAISSYKNAQSIASYFEIACMDMIESQNIVVDIPKPASEEKEIEKPIFIQPENQAEENMHAYSEDVIEEKNSNESEIVSSKDDLALNTVVMDADMVVQLLVQCTKEEKAEDTKKLQQILQQIVPDKYLTNIRQSNIIASGSDCILFEVGFDAIANVMNEETYNRGLYQYLKEKCGIDKMPFITSTKTYQDAVQKFIQCRKTHTLPKPLKIERYTIEVETEEVLNSEQKMLKAFGDKMLEIIDGGK